MPVHPRVARRGPLPAPLPAPLLAPSLAPLLAPLLTLLPALLLACALFPGDATARPVAPAPPAPASPGSPSLRTDCPALSAALRRMPYPLPRTAQALAAATPGGATPARPPLRIVALGSSSTAGYGAATSRDTYPNRLAVELSRRTPGLAVEMINAGVGGQTVADMVARIDRDVLAHRPDLVIWQVGSNAVLRTLTADAFEQLVREGGERIRASGADLLLMGVQYAPRILAHQQKYQAVRAAITRVADQLAVPVFDRFGLMQSWEKAMGAEALRAWLHKDGLHMNTVSYRCLARSVADFLIQQP